MPNARVTFKTAYGKKSRLRLAFPPDEGQTKQEFRDEADINVIMKRYEATGVIEYVQKREAQFADVTGRDYQTAMDIIADARSAFEELPASLRLEFNNDPGELLDFVSDEANREEAIELGLLSPEAVERARKRASESGQPAAPQPGAQPGGVSEGAVGPKSQAPVPEPQKAAPSSPASS